MKRKEFIKNGLLLVFSGSALLSACSKEDITSPSDGDDDSCEDVDTSSCDTATGVSKIICLADTLKAQLNSTQLAALQLSYSKSDAIRWSNFPQQLFSLKRVGLNFGAMTSSQIGYAKALIKELSGSTVENEGYSEIEQILNADDYLYTVNSGGGYGSDNYYLAFLGTPATTGTFAIMFGGHHLAFQNTYKDGVLTGATPSFRGVEPRSEFTYNGITNKPLIQEYGYMQAALAALSATQIATAKLTTTVSDLVAGPQQDDKIPSVYSGIKCSNLSTTQKDIVLDIIKTYVYDVAEYATFLNTYESELDDTYVAYSGNADLQSRGDYFRIHGPSVWIEWAMQPPVALNEPHVHSVWRDRTMDYGGN